MLESSVTLSDGLPCIVLRLGVFALDDVVEPADTSPFTYVIRVGENEVTQYLPLDEWEKDADRFLTPSVKEPEDYQSREWYDWFENNLFWAARYHREQQREDIARERRDTASYILSHCISEDDRKRVITPADYRLVYHAATVPQIELGDLAAALHRSLRATFDGKQVLQLLLDEQDTDSTKGARINGLRAWEIEAINVSGLTEAQWGELSLQERARRIVGTQYKAWLEGLTWQKEREDKVPDYG